MMKRLQLLIVFLIAAIALQAQAPAHYYNSASGKTGDELKLALHDIIDNHTTITYNQIWNAFKTTDTKGNNVVWDMYSDGAGYTYYYDNNPSDQCGSYDSEGDCYNREHSWPKSWFTGNENSVPGRDLHHIFPTDGYVNQQRSDNPFGEVQTATKTFQNGSKLGTCKSSLGYTGTVYEPIDEYKGDFARAYFYMSVRYYGEDSDWGSSGMTTKSELKPWAIAMLLDWNEQDPVSQKEIDRNNVIYNSYQHNRNPFIDHPEYAGMIWGSDPGPGHDVFEGTFSQYTADIVEGDYIIIYNGHALTNALSNTNKLTSTDVTPQNNKIIDPSRSIVWHISNISNTNYWTIKNDAVNKYAAGKTTKNEMALLSEINDMAKWTPSRSNSVFEFENYGRSQLASSQNPENKLLRCNEQNNANAWAPYANGVGGKVTLYKYTPTMVEYAYSVNGDLGSPTTIVKGGSIASLQSGTNLNTDYTFAGWTDDLDDIENNIHAAGTSYQVNDNVVLYAVYAHQIGGTPTITYNKVTSTPSDWSGEYLIVYESASKVLDGGDLKDATGNYITVTISNGIIESNNTTNAATFTIAKISNTSNYSIKNANNNYIGNTKTGSNKNGLSISSTNVYTNSLSYDNNNVNITASNGTYLRFNSNTGSGEDRFRYYASGQQPIQLYKKTTTTPTVTTYYIRVQELPAGNTNIGSITAYDLITVPSGSVLTITGTANTGTAENLVIENGGQLIVPDNATVAATVKKTTLASTAKTTNNWYIISSPVDNVTVESVACGTYNMYYYNEPNNMWMNDKVGENPANLTVQFANLINGRGYLYRSTEADVEYVGNVNAGDDNGEVTISLSYANTNANLKGFNLIGNPYTHDIYKNDVAQTGNNLPAINSDKLTVGFYKLKADGTWDAKYGKDNPIKPGEAVLVKAIASGALAITNTTNNAATYTPTDKSDYDNIMFAVSNSKYTDIAYAMFNEGTGLNKIEHHNKDIQMLYITKDDADYAIAMMDDNTNVINLGFEAKTLGQYILSFKAEGDFSCLHLIDRITGEDIDMLIEDEYSFIGAPSDMKNRFIVKFRCNSIANASDDVFAYQNGDDIIVEGTGILQVFDVTGRIIANHSMNGVEIIGKPTRPGLYVFRLVGEDVKTQKIVVK